MHKSTDNFRHFKQLTSEIDRAPNNLQKILTHMSIREAEDEVTYQDLDFEDFDDAEMETVACNSSIPFSLIHIIRG